MKKIFTFGLLALLAFAAFYLIRFGSLIGESKMVEEPLQVTFRALEPVPLEGSEPIPEFRITEAALSESDTADEAAAPIEQTTCHVRFVDPDGFPVRGVKAYFHRHEDTAALSNGLGDASVSKAVGVRNSYLGRGLSYSHPDFAPGRVDAKIPAGVETQLGEVTLLPAGSVEVLVLDPEGAPLAGAWVQWTEHGAHGQMHSRLEERRLDATRDGLKRAQVRIPRFTRAGQRLDHEEVPLTNDRGITYLNRIPEGQIRLWAGAKEMGAVWSSPVEIRRGMMTSQVTLTLGVINFNNFIRVHVLRPDGEPCAHVQLKHEYRTPFSSGSGSTSLDEAGFGVLACDSKRTYDLRANDRRGRYASVRYEGAEGGDDLVLQLTEAQFTELRITVENGPMQTLSVDVLDNDHGYLPGLKNIDPLGETQRLALPTEDFMLVVKAAGHEALELGPFPGLETPKEISIHLKAIPTISGRVLANGEPLGEARVELYKIRDFEGRVNGYSTRVASSTKANGVSRGNGTFELTLRASGRYFLRVEAPGYAPFEQGPFGIDVDEGLTGLEANLTPGGTIEGQVLGLAENAGHIVVASRGDGKASTTRSAGDGSFRFERLTPGPWYVGFAEEEISPRSTSGSSSSDPFQESQIKVNCTVVEGQITKHTLLLPDANSNLLEGTLMLDGLPASGWVASIRKGSALTMTSGRAVECEVGSDGAYRLQAPEAGAYTLVLRHPNSMVMLTTSVDIGGAPATRKWAFQTGALRLTQMAPASAENPVVTMVRGTHGSMNLLIAPRPDAAGPVLIGGIPIMPSELIQLDFSGFGDPFTGGKVLAAIELLPGETLEVAVPK